MDFFYLVLILIILMHLNIMQSQVYASIFYFCEKVDEVLAKIRPSFLIFFTIICTLSVLLLTNLLVFYWHIIRRKGIRQLFFSTLRKIPIIRKEFEKQQSQVINKIKKQLKISDGNGLSTETFVTFPEASKSPSEILSILRQRWGQDPPFKQQQRQQQYNEEVRGNRNKQVVLEENQLENQYEKVVYNSDGFDSKVSGTVYVASKELKQLLNEAYGMYSLSNPMHSDVFPSVRQIESEVVKMTSTLLGGDEHTCGCVTSGGTESILLAVLAARNYMRQHKGITQPELVVADSGHAAYHKAAQYFGITLVSVPVHPKTFKLTARDVQRHISRNTIMVVAAAPGFPHGVIDEVVEIAKLTKRRRILLHVDCCLGGFVLPFARKLGYSIPEFDFSVEGVTSISADTHKFGMSHKGTAVLMYKNAGIRKFQYASITEWTGGLYISPGLAGSRAGGLSVTAWSAILYHGWQGYLESTQKIMEVAKQFEQGIQQIEGLEVVGKPDMCLVAFRSNDPQVNIYFVNDLLSSRGWSLNALQHPAALHICFTFAHTKPGWIDVLIDDLKECVQQARQRPELAKEGSAPMYGFANQTPDREALGEFLVAYQDVLLDS
eukprot:TRINITY_DN2604_c0_g1_i1.p1 TRINITY_DN2604_c0_g1~~TRINITY_DN2604_c0_g1_i1.p1  ORF type:complete len:606 (-),score=52.21 TRINITY_DN2604_c0_g1_i1:512-2329(-)